MRISMKYRLKDHELQKKLDTLSEVHQFSVRFQTACERQFRDLFNYVRVEFGRVAVLDGSDAFTHVFFILKSDIEEYEEYNPKKWNEWPDVTPPEDKEMRVEIWSTGDNFDKPQPVVPRCLVRTSGTFSGGVWCVPGVRVFSSDRLRFKPWDDEEDEE